MILKVLIASRVPTQLYVLVILPPNSEMAIMLVANNYKPQNIHANQLRLQV